MSTTDHTARQRAAERLSPHPLEVRPNCWMIGHRNPESLLQCNTYMRVFGEGPQKRRVCVDPGSQFDYSVVEGNVRQLAGDMQEVDTITVNHQDPDVIGNTPYFCEANPKINLVVTEDTWRLAQHLLLKPGRVSFANRERANLVSVAAKDDRWELVPTPFCHFRGAMAFYDPEMRTLFSGDLFGGFNQLGRVHLFAEEGDWAGIAQFHQIYMPTNEALRYAVRQIRSLQPELEVIAPQHGHVIAGDLVHEFLDRMERLLVGHDLLSLEFDEKSLSGYQEILAGVLEWAREVMSEDEILTRLQTSEPADGLERLIDIKGSDVTLKHDGYAALVKVFNRLGESEGAEFRNSVRSIVFNGCSERNLPIPPIGAGLEEESLSSEGGSTPPKAR